MHKNHIFIAYSPEYKQNISENWFKIMSVKFPSLSNASRPESTWALKGKWMKKFPPELLV